MKKIIVIIICLIFLVGCNKQNEESPKAEETPTKEEFVLKKKDDNKDYIVLTPIKELIIDEEPYTLNNLEINIVSEDIDNVNLEIKTFVNNASKNQIINGNYLTQGTVINFDYYITDKYISVVEKHYLYINGFKGEENDNIYVISLSTGKVLNNKDLLTLYDLTEEKIYELLEEKVDSEDPLYTILNIKNHGYNLYINNANNLCIIYNEINDDEEIRKELVLN